MMDSDETSVFNHLIFKRDSYNSSVDQGLVDGIMARPFHPVEELFPKWKTARFMIARFCRGCGGFEVTQSQTNKSQIDISLKYPMVRDLISGNMVTMQSVFPEEDRGKFEMILSQVMVWYCPNLSEFHGGKITQESLWAIKMKIRGFESEIVHLGGRTLRDELFFQFGINSWRTV